MNNLIEELKEFIENNKNSEVKYTLWFNNLGNEMKIPYAQAEFLVEVITSLEATCNELVKSNLMFQDYNRLLKKENEELRECKGE